MSEKNQQKREKPSSPLSIMEMLEQLLAIEKAASPKDSRGELWGNFTRFQSRRMFRIAVRLRVPRHLIEDLIQDVWLKILPRWDSFRQPDGARRLLALSRKMMHDAALDLRRHLTVCAAVSLDTTPTESIDPKASSPADGAEENELRQWVTASLERLSQKQPNYAWLLRERFIVGRSIGELAEEKGLTEHAIHCQITRAYKALKRRLPELRPDG